MVDESWDTRASYYIPGATDPKNNVWLSTTSFESELKTYVWPIVVIECTLFLHAICYEYEY